VVAAAHAVGIKPIKNSRSMVMVSGLSRRRRAALIGVLALSASLGWSGADAGPIPWTKQGAFEVCLDRSLDEWLRVQAELVVNEDAAAGRLDDAAVARWTVDTLAACRARVEHADAESGDRFAKHMVRWRHHIYDLVTSIRQKGTSD
jgi:hypothetical protein